MPIPVGNPDNDIDCKKKITSQYNVVFKDHVTNIREIKYSVEEHCSYYLLQTHATMQYITTYFIVKKIVGEVQTIWISNLMLPKGFPFHQLSLEPF